MTTGQRIKAARKRAGLTQKELGEKMGQSFQSIAQWENDLRNPKLETLQRIASALGVSIYELTDNDELKRAVLYGERLGGDSDEQDDSSEIHYHTDFDGSHSRVYSFQDAPDIHLHAWQAKRGVMVHGTTPMEMDAQGSHLPTLIQTRKDRVKRKWFLSAESPPEHKFTTEEIKALVAALENEYDDEEGQREREAFITALKPKISRPYDPKARIAAALDRLNDEGQEKVVDFAEDLAAIPKYQRTATQEGGGESPPPAGEGTDTTPAETPSEGRIQAVTMVCPICGQHLSGDLVDGKAHCDYCKRSFPLPQILK